MDTDALSIISDYDGDGATVIQKYWRSHAAVAMALRWKPYLLVRSFRRKAALVVHRLWICYRLRKKVRNVKQAVVILQAHARRKYQWGINDECREAVMRVLELKNCVVSMRHALSIIQYLQFLVDHPELFDLLHKCKE
jgi:hypothetical protein